MLVTKDILSAVREGLKKAKKNPPVKLVISKQAAIQDLKNEISVLP